MKKRSLYPIMLCPHLRKKNVSIFYLPGRTVSVYAPAKIISKIIMLCRGTESLFVIARQLEKTWDRASVQKLLALLLENGVIVDAHSLQLHTQEFVGNPTYFFATHTDRYVWSLVEKSSKQEKISTQGKTIPLPINRTHFQELLAKRKSHRTFRRNSSISQESLSALLWSGYGRIEMKDNDIPSRRTVPSAGALYPLRISLILLTPVGDMQPGIYRVYFGEKYSVTLSREGDIDDVHACFVDPLILENACGVIVISGSYEWNAKKYTNRSLLYVPLEAGHSAQNIHLAALSEDIATVEIGGFLEKSLMKIIGLGKDYVPLTTIIFGKATTEELHNSLGEIHWREKVSDRYTIPFYMCFGRMPTWKKGEWACGRSRNANHASQKVISEMLEWNAFTDLNGVIYDAYENLDPSVRIHPEQIVRYHPLQYRNGIRGCHPFNESDDKAGWVCGVDIKSGKEKFVLADLVLYPYQPRSQRYSYANSSGCATHQSIEKAVESALYELAERDAFLLHWINQISPRQITHQSLPSWARVRIQNLEKAGLRVSIADMSFEIPVIFLSGISESDGVFICSAASSPDPQEMLEKALMELEASFFCFIEDPKKSRILATRVQFPEDHAALYTQKHAIDKARFLLQGTRNTWKAFAKVARQKTKRSIQTLLIEAGYDNAIVIDRTSSIAESLGRKTVRVIVPGLVPMYFGYGLASLGLPRIIEAPILQGYMKKVLGFGKLNTFPHPFN